VSEGVDRVRVFGETAVAAERIAPGFFGQSLEAEHLARYRWAARCVNELRVLDAACGTGYGAEILRSKGARSVVSVDISAEALAFGLARYKLRAIGADAQSLPFTRQSFDAVVSLETIEHLRDPSEFLRSLAQVLRPGGTLLLSTPNADRSDGCNPHHLKELSLVELLGLARAAGFSAVSVRGQHWKLRGFSDHVRGFRRISWEIERRPGVWHLPSWIARPVYWCVRFERAK